MTELDVCHRSGPGCLKTASSQRLRRGWAGPLHGPAPPEARVPPAGCVLATQGAAPAVGFARGSRAPVPLGPDLLPRSVRGNLFQSGSFVLVEVFSHNTTATWMCCWKAGGLPHSRYFPPTESLMLIYLSGTLGLDNPSSMQSILRVGVQRWACPVLARPQGLGCLSGSPAAVVQRLGRRGPWEVTLNPGAAPGFCRGSGACWTPGDWRAQQVWVRGHPKAPLGGDPAPWG